MTTAATADPKVIAEIYSLALALIDPDPDQPRIDVDDELAESIRTHGVQQSIEVRPHPEHPDRYMIVDGERRYRGAKKAGLTTIPATLTFDVEGVNKADRLVRQIVRNDGKRLTPIEEALAFAAIITERRLAGDKAFGPVQLSRELGMKKSTVTDRLVLASLPKIWLDLVKRGKLQPSAAPILNRWQGVPLELQRRALSVIVDDYTFRNHDTVTNEDLEDALFQHLGKFIKPLSEVGASYTGPVAELRQWQGSPAKKYAMDPSIWQPIVQKRQKAERAKAAAERKTSGSSRSSKAKAKKRTLPRWVTAMVEKGATHKRVEQYIYTHNLPGTNVLLVSGNKHQWVWPNRQRETQFYDPAVLLQHVKPSDLTVYTSQYQYENTPVRVFVTSDAALRIAASAFQKERDQAFARIKAAISAKVGKAKVPVTGAGAKHLLELALWAQSEHDDHVARLIDDVATALELPAFADVKNERGTTARYKAVEKAVAGLTAAAAVELATAVAAFVSLGIESPDHQLTAWEKKTTDGYQGVHPKDWRELGKDVAAKGDEEVEDEDEPAQPDSASEGAGDDD